MTTKVELYARGRDSGDDYKPCLFINQRITSRESALEELAKRSEVIDRNLDFAIVTTTFEEVPRRFEN